MAIVQDSAADAPVVVTARLHRLAKVATATAVVILGVFAVTAAVMRSATAGAHFVADDTIGTVVIGIVLAGVALLPVRPRLYADAEQVRWRTFLGGERSLPWEAVVRVEFPANSHFARLVMPGEELITLYAVHRTDYDQALRVMKGLRALHAAAHLPADHAGGPIRPPAGGDGSSQNDSDSPGP